MVEKEPQIYTETENYKFRKDSANNYYDIEVVNNNLDKIDNTIKKVENETRNVQSDWNITNANLDSFIKNKPSSLPANGGTADTIKNTLPINKGGTGAENILGALKNLNILNNTLPNNLPLSSSLVYKDFSDFGIASTRMFEFASLMPDYCSIIFQNDKSKSAYITDVPTETGIIFFFKTSKHFRYALFFSNERPDINVYRWISNTDILLKNWTKINDEGNAFTLNNHEDTYFATSSQVTTINNTLNNKVDKVTGKGLSTNDFTAVYKTKLEGIQAGAEVNVQSDWNITDTNADSFIKNKPINLPANGGNADTVDGKHASEFASSSQITTINNALNNKVDKVTGKGLSTNDFTAAYKTKLDGIQEGAEVNIQSDWNVTDTNADSFIKNKPINLPANGGNADTVDGKHASEFASSSQVTTINNTLNNKVDKVTGKGLSTNDFTAAYKTKLDGIQTGAEVNIQSDWNVTDTNSDAFIKNKPSSLSANGGNSDTVDGKHASDFAPSGFGLGTNAKSVTGDWNNYIETGFYYGNNLLNEPPTIKNDNNYWYVISIKFDANCCAQIGFKFNMSNSIYTRRKMQSQWFDWVPIGNSFNIANRNLLPVSKATSYLRDIPEYTNCGIGTRVNNIYMSAKVFSSLNLKTNQYYTLSFVAWSKGGDQNIICDLYPDTLPEKEFKITNIPSVYIFTFISQSSDMSNCMLRFFNEQHVYVAEVCITDIKLEEGKNRTSYSFPPEDMYNYFTKPKIQTTSTFSNNIKNDEIIMIYE